MNALHEFTDPRAVSGPDTRARSGTDCSSAADVAARGAFAPALPPTVDILGFPIGLLNTDQLVETAIAHAVAGKPLALCYVNAHVINLAGRHERFAKLLRSADVLFADGVSIVWASRFASTRLPERMTANDYYPRFMTRCAEEGLRVFLLGGRPGVAEKAAAAMRAVEPTLRIVGTHHGHYGAVGEEAVIDRINGANVDVLLAGLSTPRQEFFVMQTHRRLQVPVRWCVGAMFDYWAGLESPAPAWACRMNAEWLYRLAVDPMGKWRRYLLGNPRFIWNTLRWGMRSRDASQRRELGQCQ